MNDGASPRLPLGHYSFEWSGGIFRVQLRAAGTFWCPDFQEAATWAFEPETMTLDIDWGKYGQYVLRFVNEGEGAQVSLAGSARGDESNWRKMHFVRPFSEQEQLVSGSVWKMHFEEAEPLRVEFRADGRFMCPSCHPGKHTYALNGDDVTVNCCEYESCEFKLHVSDKMMTGSAICTFLPLAGTFQRLEYVEPLPAFVPPELCPKGCCLKEDEREQCKPGHKRGQLEELPPPRPKISWGFDVPTFGRPCQGQ
eukprot:CAMPEP_0119061010 /NCGR_PEP_ID=MMETSP1178-20130426/4885_1 /TAXON_ID=33656 /ORGANISM="unid sp, Strain CCMP2000" /LENGTH=252 /DNA_ID=CAMNT_0007042175 /DNA_START=57 /DNA_END=815 /DNA_ORIENTATION=+